MGGGFVESGACGQVVAFACNCVPKKDVEEVGRSVGPLWRSRECVQQEDRETLHPISKDLSRTFPNSDVTSPMEKS